MSKSNKDYDLPIFDIETGSLEFEDCKAFAPEHLLHTEPMPWMVQEYKDGLPKNYKEETREKKAQEWVFNYNVEIEQSKWMEKSALDPTRGFICWFGMKTGGGEYIHLQATEPAEEYELLREATELLQNGGISHNGTKFDLPFIWMRSILQGMEHPLRWQKGRYARPEFVDTRDLWEQNMGDRYRLHAAGLDFISGVMGWPKKPGKATDFFGWLCNGELDKCTEYSQHDLDICEKLAILVGAKTPKEE